MTVDSAPSDETSASKRLTSTPSQKSAATVSRRKSEDRAERLRNIRAQTEDGTLVIRQMTDEQYVTASQDARRASSRYAAAPRRYRSPSDAGA